MFAGFLAAVTGAALYHGYQSARNSSNNQPDSDTQRSNMASACFEKQFQSWKTGNGSFKPRPADVLVVKAMLGKTSEIPPEVIDMIIDHAEYWPHTETTRQDESKIRITSDQLLLRTPPIGFLESQIPDRDEWTTAEIPSEAIQAVFSDEDFQKLLKRPTLEHPVRKIVWKIRSRDQGWGGDRHDQGTFHGSWTWFEAGLDKLEKHGDGATGNQTVLASRPTFDVENLRRIHPTTEVKMRRIYPTTEVKIEHGVEKQKYPLLPSDRYKIQSNRTASRNVVDYDITWSWTDDIKPNSPEGDRLVEQGRGRATGTGDFVRSLKLGDVVTIWGKARFPGWANHVENVSVEVYWAV